ncbi:MAG: hypothetical protein A3C50_02130 [Candidatus Staskawiczbacteria bacterium RIFCSPHIGHO2_02_FULL_43_16]|uniref:Thioredoxin domain-containing protein n=1 Tax=Candidatus Staskawiczbacteria bacterium RIFCSPHIGHO2_01_FULL_41_41 TaxID=1802203 RepID=A0A1G2HW25_9BACT|nr:MAG: hypothetical protein A2822_00500 [Candidatus Staskawiczbacteria bacterium RIFCSPHIGHO2_01_FULL_41_41]OGZ68476.1 MAG: hypothetical protein A3C50_02130 [Candidatus Staskawiczbacteria bacterium RIFCSPHIGHO2_02_FULL_43_16]OGZ74280.1 MAG: hypothetical protein A3A12_02565 [Candidatus Staskawiczbacteria bacterium RIFCSPLOWO2_01_FULL_43_17b]
MDEKLKWGIITIIIISVIAGGFFVLQNIQHAKAVKLQQFATCLKDSGAVFYGAFWCSHCQNQKAMFNTLFESAVDKLPYIECSTPDTNGQLEICKTEKIDTYPTWKFADGSVETGEVSLQKLSQKTNCPLP